MKQTRRFLQTSVLWMIDILCILGAYLLATQIRFAVAQDWGDKTLHYMVGILFLLVCTVYSFLGDWNKDFIKRGDFEELLAVLRMLVLMLPVTITLVYFLRWSRILSRSVILHFTWISFVLLYLSHFLYKRALRKALMNDQFVTRVFVVTQKEELEETLRRLKKAGSFSYQITEAAILSSDFENEGTKEGQTFFCEGIPVFEGGGDLTRFMTKESFDEVFINTPDLTGKKMARLIDGFEEMGVTCHYSLDFPDTKEAGSRVGMFGGYPVASYSRYRENDKGLLIKRMTDILGGIVGVLITAVITVFLAPAIKLDSPGPVFFSQTRVGKNGRRFRIYKFRSMYRDAEQRRKELEKENEMEGLMFKMDNDPRVTCVGRFIRKTSLDEFPQFMNVLKGDMSLVGTRPPTEEEFEAYDEHYRRRLSMKPGLTGLWQVSGRSEISKFDEVVKLDLEYIDTWSLSKDLKILLQTIAVVLGGKGAR